ncbi:hypothetical protein CHCC15337_1998 [Bacillus paralicheniformis]|nr:hypothetical protein LI6934_12335 [Bacillus licheniformis LMG 6934]TWJ52104.1 hypothetical protein CHCC5023_4225 [Bacillus paralicheniformis]TWJ66433.1 hypothetical protein CHCC5021_0709 [Bacillus paralicheniformis]TWJ70673.1 hypothetical protein CHCC5019_3734 [Bacillus paralicheniformis]TWL46407.1 hypothetical protein CHCC15337_1998 [Bacillus paralicheniformis]
MLHFNNRLFQYVHLQILQNHYDLSHKKKMAAEKQQAIFTIDQFIFKLYI